MDSLKNWMVDAANILFDDSKNDLRSLPKTVRLQILLVLSFIWTTVFSLYVFSYTTFAFGWAGLYVAHIGLIFAVYMTFKHFHKAEEQSASVFKTKNFDPFKIMVIVFVVVFIFIFSKGIEVLTSPNPSSYSIPYDGPLNQCLKNGSHLVKINNGKNSKKFTINFNVYNFNKHGNCRWNRN